MKFTKDQLQKITTECGLFIPTNQKLSLEEILDSAWDRNLIVLEKLSHIGKLYFYGRIEALRGKQDCFGILHEEENLVCKSCRIQARCNVVTNLPSRVELEKLNELLEKNNPDVVVEISNKEVIKELRSIEERIKLLKDKSQDYNKQIAGEVIVIQNMVDKLKRSLVR